MASIFISHSQHDKELVSFISTVFAGTKVKACFEEFEKLATGVVTSAKILEDIDASSAVFLLLSRNVERIPHTRDWVVWESGAAKMKPIWVFESLDEGQSVSIAVPHLNNYVLFARTDEWRTYLRQVVNSFDNSSLLPTVLGTAGAGGAIAKDSFTGALVGGIAGVLLHAITRNQPAGINVACPKCQLTYAIHVPSNCQTFRCPSCNQWLQLQDTAGAIHARAAQSINNLQRRAMPKTS